MPVTKNEVYLLKYARSLVAAGRSNVQPHRHRHPDATRPGGHLHRAHARRDPGTVRLLARSADEHRTDGEVWARSSPRTSWPARTAMVRARSSVTWWSRCAARRASHSTPRIVRVYRLDESIPGQPRGAGALRRRGGDAARAKSTHGRHCARHAHDLGGLATPVTTALGAYRAHPRRCGPRGPRDRDSARAPGRVRGALPPRAAQRGRDPRRLSAPGGSRRAGRPHPARAHPRGRRRRPRAAWQRARRARQRAAGRRARNVDDI